MKKIIVALLSLATFSANAQTVDEIISKYSAAMGGLDNFNKVTTAKFTGTVSMQGQAFPMTLQVVNGKAARTDLDIMGQSVVNVYDNGKGWKINPYAGASTATEISGAELTAARNQSNIANNLMDYASRGHKVELLGQEDVEGIKTNKIKLTTKEDGKEFTFFINTADNLLIKSVGKREIQGQELEIETFYSDFKDVNGLKFSFMISQKIQGQAFQEIKYEKVELNVPVDEKIFKM
jgi:hypothetical protein